MMRTGAADHKAKRPYVRKQTNNAPGVVAPTSPPQISGLAFNIHGWALEDGMLARSTFETINAYNATMVKGGFEQKIADLHESNQGEVYRTDLTYTPRELDPNLAQTDPAVCQYLVVGYTLQEEDPIFQSNKTFARYSENELVGESRPEANNFIPWNSVRTPILVVTPIKENTGTSVRLFGLVMPRSGLCQPVLLTHERIFYRWEFRASAGARAPQRNKNWNQVVIDKARELMPAGMYPPRGATSEEKDDNMRPVKQRRLGVMVKQEDDDEVFPDDISDSIDIDIGEYFELELALENLFEPLSERYSAMTIPRKPAVSTAVKVVLDDENRVVFRAIHSNQSERMKQEVHRALARLNASFRILPRDPSCLQHYTCIGSFMTQGEAEMASREINAIWPQIGHLAHPGALLRIRAVMNNTQQVVTSNVMEEFLRFILVSHQIRPDMTDVELAHQIYEAIEKSQMMTQFQNAGMDTNVSADTMLVVALLKELLLIHDWQRVGTKPLLSMQMPASFDGLTIEHQLDIQMATVEDGLQENLKFLLRSARRRGCGSEDIVLWFERLRLRIKQV